MNPQDIITALEALTHDELRLVTAHGLHLVPSDQPLGTPLHTAICAKSISVAFEPVMLRRSETGGIEVYLLQRTSDNVAYAGEHYVGGNFERPNNVEPEAAAIARSAEKFGCEGLCVVFLDSIQLRDDRGPLRARVHLVTPIGEPTNGQWVPVDSLEELEGGVVDNHQERYIPLAIAAFEQREKAQEG